MVGAAENKVHCSAAMIQRAWMAIALPRCDLADLYQKKAIVNDLVVSQRRTFRRAYRT